MLTLLVANAFALDCLYGLDNTNIDRGDMPPNVEIAYTMVGMADPAVPVLLDADGNEVPATHTDHGDFHTLRPDLLLAEGEYTLSSDWDIPFTVSGPEDLDPPGPPTFLDARRRRTSSQWGSEHLLEVTFDTVPRGTHLEIELSVSGDFASDGVGVLSWWPDTTLGDGLCLHSPSSYDHGEDYFLRARLVDDAGNVSDWVEHDPARTRLLGCSTAGMPVFGVLPLLLLGLMRRRS
jgi:uncharacterized protein (TIGR03382 family)